MCLSKNCFRTVCVVPRIYSNWKCFLCRHFSTTVCEAKLCYFWSVVVGSEILQLFLMTESHILEYMVQFISWINFDLSSSDHIVSCCFSFIFRVVRRTNQVHLMYLTINNQKKPLHILLRHACLYRYNRITIFSL